MWGPTDMLTGNAHNTTNNERRHGNYIRGRLRQRRCDLFLNLKILGIAYHDFGRTTVFGDLARHADLFIPVLFFRSAEFVAALSPNQDREGLVRVWLIEVQER